jgi:hypothetical protein
MHLILPRLPHARRRRGHVSTRGTVVTDPPTLTRPSCGQTFRRQTTGFTRNRSNLSLFFPDRKSAILGSRQMRCANAGALRLHPRHASTTSRAASVPFITDGQSVSRGLRRQAGGRASCSVETPLLRGGSSRCRQQPQTGRGTGSSAWTESTLGTTSVPRVSCGGSGAISPVG